MVRGQRGQATIEWTAIVLLIAVAFGLAAFAATRAGAWRLGDELVDAMLCALEDGCPGALEDVYGEDVARAVRTYAPNIVYERSSAQLPVDFRRCRRVECADGPARAAAVGESGLGLPVTAFTRVIDRRLEGGPLYLQYWVYFPESFSAGIGRRLGPLSESWPGRHADDWEGYQVRFAGGRPTARATAHGRYRNFKDSEGWGPWTGWYRISGGSHAGHLVQSGAGERTTPADAIRLVPLERLVDTGRHRFEVSPPWRKQVYEDPESEAS